MLKRALLTHIVLAKCLLIHFPLKHKANFRAIPYIHTLLDTFHINGINLKIATHSFATRGHRANITQARRVASPSATMFPATFDMQLCQRVCESVCAICHMSCAPHKTCHCPFYPCFLPPFAQTLRTWFLGFWFWLWFWLWLLATQ